MSAFDPGVFEKMVRDHAQLDDGLRVTMEMQIRVHANGALSVSIPVDDEDYCLAMLRHAEDAIRRQSAARREIVVPGKDVSLRLAPG